MSQPTKEVAGKRAPRARRSHSLQFLCFLLLAGVLPGILHAQVQFVGRQDSVGTFAIPNSVALDAAGNVYVTDVGTGSVYKLDRFGNRTTVGRATGPFAVAVDSAGNIYYTSFGNNCVNKVPAGGGSVVCLGAGLSSPIGIATDAAGNLYVADNGNLRVVEIAVGGAQTTLATGFSELYSVAVDMAGNVYAADYSTTTITKIPPGGGSSTTVGSGLDAPQGVAVDADGNVYVSQPNAAMVEITASGTQSTLPITGLSDPFIPAVDANGNLYIPNYGNGKVVLFNASGASLGYAEVCSGGYPPPCTQTATLNFNFVTVSFASATYFSVGVSSQDFSQASTTCTASSTSCSITVQFHPVGAGARAGAVVVTDSDGNAVQVPLYGAGFGAEIAFLPSIASLHLGADGFQDPFGITVDGKGLVNGGHIYVADASACQIFQLTSSGGFAIIAGNGTCGYSGDGGAANLAELKNPDGVMLDGAGNIFIVDSGNSSVRKVNLSGNISTIAGSPGLSAGYGGDGGPATSAQLNLPISGALDAAGNLYIADTGNSRIRKVDVAGNITTIAGTGTAGYSGDGGFATAAELNQPWGVSVDAAGNIYIADTRNNIIRKINLAGTISTVAGNFGLGAGSGGDEGPATSAQLNSPTNVTVDTAGELFICDANNHRVRIVDGSGMINTYGPSVSYPSDLAVDVNGNLAIMDNGASVFDLIERTQPAPVSFGTQDISTSSEPQFDFSTNIGNQPLAFSSFTADTGFSINLSEDPCSTSSPLGAGLSCLLGFAFVPTATGSITGAIHLTDNSLGPEAGSTQTISVSGTGLIAPTTTTLTAAPNPGATGQTVTLTATVAPTPSGSPLGTVNFLDGTTSLGTPTINSSGVAMLTISTLTKGTHSLTAVYSGNTDFATSTSTAVSLVILAATTTTLTATPNPSMFAQSVTLTATITSTATGAPTGTVTFMNGATSLGTGTLNGSGVATLTTSTLPAGTLSLTAVYAGDSNFATSTSTALSFTVNKAATATTLAAAPNPVNRGQQVTLTATISPIPTGTPLGAVTFLNGTTTIGTATPNASGVATLTSTTLPAGALSLTASYGGNANFAASTSTAVTLNVISATATVLVAAPSPAAFDQSVTLTATITPAPTGSPAGTVTFLNGSTSLGTATPNASGVATLATSSLPVGSLSLTASYGGNVLFAASTSTAFALTVNLAPTTTALTASPSPATFGKSVTLTATVTPTPTGSSLGTITFFSGATNLGNAALGATGSATLMLATLPAGSLSLTASYSGNTDFTASTSSAVPLTVNTTFEITAPTTPFVVGQGGLITVPVSIPPLGGAYNSVVTMSISGLPKASTDQFVPASVTPGAVTGSTTLTIQLAPLAAKNTTYPPLPGTHLPAYAALTLLLFVRRKRLRASLRHTALLLAAALLGSVLLGCNGGFLRPPSTPPGSYTVTITGTSGTTVQSAQITVVVQ